MLKAGIPPKNSGLSCRKIKHNTQTNTIPPAIPSGIAKRHQFKASLRTNRITCLGVVPMQRTIPKNSVLCATLLFILLVIINTPAIRTRINNMTATAYTCNIKELLLCPNSPSNSVFSDTCSSDNPNCCLISAMLP